jgi:dTDP-4-dehydrorhamnose 3,5-epimerase
MAPAQSGAGTGARGRGGSIVIFTRTKIEGACLIDVERHGDVRGFFGRLFCADSFREQGLPDSFVQQNLSVSARRGTVRGLHYQLAPHGEAKLVRCSRGALVDVVVDLRPDSPSYLEWASFTLTAESLTQLLVPAGCAHGFQTLQNDTEISYLVSHRYTPEAERGLRWNDPAFGIEWPLVPSDMSPKDRNWPDFQPEKVA